MRFDVVTRASPEQVARAFTDFSERRPETWSRTLDPRTYEVHDSGPTWATARESTPGSPFWVTCRYEWTDPRRISWSVVDSSYGGGGDGHVRIEPGPDGGSRVHAEWTSTGGRPLQRPLLFLLHHGPAWRLVARLWRQTLDDLA